MSRNEILEHLQPLGFCGYVHNTFHKSEKLGIRANKYIFTRYLESSKGFAMNGEHFNGGVTEIESCDIIFIENDFLNLSEVTKDLEVYELQKLEGNISSFS